MRAVIGAVLGVLVVLAQVAPVVAQEAANAERIRQLQQDLERIRTELEGLKAQQQRQQELQLQQQELQLKQQEQLAAMPPPSEIMKKIPLKILGSVTFRYDDTRVEDQTDLLQDNNEINGFRIRVRLGVEYNLDGLAGAGIRLSTGESSNPTSPFIGLGDTFRSQSFNLDQYYIVTRPLKFFEPVRKMLEPIEDTTLTFGKMPNPFWRGDRGTWRSEIVWDDDVSPGGMALKVPIRTGLSWLKLENTFGYFIVNEVTDARFSGLTADSYLYANQLKLTTDPLTLAFAVYDYHNLNAGLRSPSFMPGSSAFLQGGTSALLVGGGRQATNSIVNFGPGAQGFLDDHYTILNLMGQVHYPLPSAWSAKAGMSYVEPWIAGDWVHNTRVENESTGWAITAGVTAAPINRYLGPFNFWFTYRDVDADATLSTFTDSDLGAGTAYKGFEIGANYKILPDLMLVFSYFDFEGFPRKDNQVRRWFLDLVFTF